MAEVARWDFGKSGRELLGALGAMTQHMVRVDPGLGLPLDTGRIEMEIEARLPAGPAPETLLSRDTGGLEDGCAFDMWVSAKGALLLAHVHDDEEVRLCSPQGLIRTGDLVQISYSWDFGGDYGRFEAINMTSGAVFRATVPNTVSLEGTPDIDANALLVNGEAPLILFYDRMVQTMSIHDADDVSEEAAPARARDTGVDAVQILDAAGDVTRPLGVDEAGVVPCFTPGTRIATMTGERAVETLRPGDQIITRDNGIQEIRWVGAKRMDWKALERAPHLCPILIRKGALGNGLPERDMMVSPNHRVLITRPSSMEGQGELLAPAKALVNNRGISQLPANGATYIHFMFDQHQVVLSDGAWTESFQPEPASIRGLGNAQRTEILELFPDLGTPAGLAAYQPARQVITGEELRLYE